MRLTRWTDLNLAFLFAALVAFQPSFADEHATDEPSSNEVQTDNFEDTEDAGSPPPPGPYTDQFEGFNRAMFSFNEQADRYVLKPVAQAYQFVTPKLVDEGVTNFFNNLDDVETFANSLLQGKFHNAMVSLNRFIYNTTFGLLGIIDVATGFGLVADEEDFGQTLAAWGYEDSTYIVLPLLGPSTVRDIGGFVVDSNAFDALSYVEELNEDERYMLFGLKVVDLRADLLAAENLMTGGDKYLFLRNAYLQNREFLINDGKVQDTFSSDEFEPLDGF